MKSLAQEFLEENEKDSEGSWLVLYDFIKKNPSPKFWKNLNKLKNLSSIRTVQYSVLLAERKSEALAAVKLAEHYGGETLLFNIEKHRLGGSIDDPVVNTNR